MSREDAVSRATNYFDSGAFRAELERRVAMPTESQGGERLDVLRSYLTEEIVPSVERLGFKCRIVEERSRAGLFASQAHPYTRALLQSVLTPDPDLGVPDTRIGSTFPNPLEERPGCPFSPRCPDAIDICRTSAPAVRELPDGWASCHRVQEGAAS